MTDLRTREQTHTAPAPWAVNQRRALLTLVATVALGLGLAGCGNAQPVPNDAAANYADALAEGHFAGACSLLDPRTKTSLEHLLGRREACTAVFARCLPNQAAVANRDQTQLFVATVQVAKTGPKTAIAQVSGIPVARAIKEVSLAKEHGRWLLTSYGEALRSCRHRAHRARRRA